MRKGRQIGAVTDTETNRCELNFSRPTQDTLLLRLGGNWRIGQKLPSADEVRRELDSAPQVKRLAFDSKQLTGWDSGLLTFLTRMRDLSLQRKIHLDSEGLPDGA